MQFNSKMVANTKAFFREFILTDALYFSLAALTVFPVAVFSYNFYPAEQHVLGGDVRGVAIGDVDNDSRNELLITTSAGSQFDPEFDHKLFVFEYSLEGELILEQKLDITPADPIHQSWSVDVADLNSDGLNDVVVGADQGIGVFYQNSAHALESISTVFSPRQQTTKSRWVRAGDFNGDGRMDVIATSSGTNAEWNSEISDAIDLYLQNAESVLMVPLPISAQERIGSFWDLIVTDINRDGLDDLVVAGSGESTISADFGVYLGSQNEPYLVATAFKNVPRTITAVAAGDIDDDGTNEIIISQSSDFLFFELSNNTLIPDGSYTNTVFNRGIDYLSTADINEDGLEDIVVGAGSTHTYFDVLVQDPTQVFPDFSLSNLGGSVRYAHSAAVGDISHDGKVDIVSSERDSAFENNRFTLFINGDQKKPVNISGAIYLDNEFDGFVVDDQPLAGIEVRLYDETNILHDAKITDSNGEYSLAAPPGNYQIEVPLLSQYSYTRRYFSPGSPGTNLINPDTGRSDFFTVEPLRDTLDITGGLSYSRDNTKLFPLVAGATYHYLDDGAPKIDTVNPILVSWGGETVSRIISNDGIYSFFTNDDAILAHGGLDINSNATQLYSPPVGLHVGDEELHRTYGAAGNATIVIPPSTLNYPYGSFRTIEGYEEVTVPAGTFQALRVNSGIWLITPSGNINIGGADWLVPGIGVVRGTSYTPGINGTESIRELQQYAIDFDGDGNYREVDNCEFISNPEQSDIDGDGIGDQCDNDNDNDLRPNIIDNCPTVSSMDILDTDHDGEGNPCDIDDDGDQMPDMWETQFGLDPLDPTDAFDDPDNDNINNITEYENDTDPTLSNILRTVPLVPWIFQLLIIAVFLLAPLGCYRQR